MTLEDFNDYIISGKNKSTFTYQFTCPGCGKIFTIKSGNLRRRIREGKQFDFLCGKCKAKKTNLDNHGGVWNNQTKEYIEKVKKTSLEKYGKEYYTQTDECKERIKSTCLKKYGVSNPGQVPEIQDKMKRTCIKKYGVEYAIKSPEVQDRLQKGMINKYGVERALLLDEFKEKSKNTNFEKYGGIWYTQTQKWKDDNKRLMRELYGVDSFNQIKISKSTLNILSSEELLEKYFEDNSNLGVHEIANKLGVCHTTILNYLHRHNLDKYLYRFPQSSKYENEIYDFLRDNYKGKIVRNCREIIFPQELDFYLPNINLALEFNGTFWHSDINKDKYYHQNKTKKCLEKGISLIHVFEYSWIKNCDLEKINIVNHIYNYFTESLIYSANRGYFFNKNYKLKEISEPSFIFINDKGEEVDETYEKRKYKIYDSGNFILERNLN